MQTQKLLIADSSEEFSLALQSALRDTYCIRICRDGIETRDLMKSFAPDILVLDMMLPGLDGISILEAAVNCGLQPMVLVTSRLFSDYVLDSLERLGVGYLMRKPCDVQAAAARIRDLNCRIHLPVPVRSDPKTQISSILLSLGISTSHRGYTYLVEAVSLMIQRPDQSVTKELYPAVAALYGARGSHVEHCIRTAIASAWEHSEEQLWRPYCQRRDASGVLQRPSNGVFISRMANLISLQEE